MISFVSVLHTSVEGTGRGGCAYFIFVRPSVYSVSYVDTVNFTELMHLEKDRWALQCNAVLAYFTKTTRLNSSLFCTYWWKWYAGESARVISFNPHHSRQVVTALVF